MRTAVPLETDDRYRSPGRVPLDGRGHPLDEWREDLARYRAHYGGALVKPLLLEQGLWALLVHRLGSAVHRSALPAALRAPLLLLAVAGQKLSEVLTGISLPYAADLAPGQYIGHFGPTVVNPAAVIGPGCNIGQGVTIGVSGRGDRRGVPRIGARVYLGANAVVAGRITVGDDAVVGANSLVTRDVPSGCTVMGVPAEVVDQHGTAGMGLHQHPA